MEKFIARYTNEKGITRSISFDKSRYNQEQAEKILNEKGIKNFFFFFEPEDPQPFGENGMHFKGEIGYDITMDNMLKSINEGKDIYLDSFGGDLYEGWKIHDAIKETGLNPTIKALGSVASSAMQIFLATENREMTPKSRLLIHNPWTMKTGDDEDFQQTANELREEKTILAKFYSEISGRSEQEMLDLMKEERFIYLEEAISLNFVKNNNQEKNEEMNDEQKKQLSVLSNMFNSIKNVFIEPKVKNIVLQDVNGVELDFGEVETQEQIAVGVTATADGDPANGEYVLADGTVYVFENGSLMEIKDPGSEGNDMEALQAENEALKEQLASLENTVSEKESIVNKLTDERTKLESDFNKVSNEFEAFKNQFSDEKQDMNTPSEGGKKNNNRKAFK